jgi:polysaccharide pyruvyl transferase WcaK-like protein
MRRILFHTWPNSISRPAISLPKIGGITPPVARTINELRTQHSLTGNRGNMIHSEATQKIFKCDHQHSCVTNLVHLFNAIGDAKKFGDKVNDLFDCLIISTANIIRPNQDYSSLILALTEIKIPIFIFSAGLQARITNSDTLTPSTIELLRFFDQHATLFSVRGNETSEFLKKIGLHNHSILGCPSLYVYPENIADITCPISNDILKITTAGHLSKVNLTRNTSKSGRAKILLNLFSEIKADYVFQDEIFSFDEIINDYLFDDSKHHFCAENINLYYRNNLNINTNFESYYYFSDPTSWRQYMSTRDVYLGDRFHGGVVSLQVGVPAVIINGDLRVSELTEYFGIPNTSFAELQNEGIHDILKNKLSIDSLVNFKNTFKERFKNFSTVCSRHGLKLISESNL